MSWAWICCGVAACSALLMLLLAFRDQSLIDSPPLEPTGEGAKQQAARDYDAEYDRSWGSDGPYRFPSSGGGWDWPAPNPARFFRWSWRLAVVSLVFVPIALLYR